MTINLAHSFDCDCKDCSVNDVNALGMARFTARKSNTIITTTPAAKSEPIRRLPAGQRVGNGRVRKISEKQEWFILKLIKERDLTNLHLVTGQTIDVDEVKYMGVKGASALIEKMLGCPIKGTDSPVMANSTKLPGSDKQIALIEKLAQERNLSSSDLAIMLKAKPTARLLIDALFAMPKPSMRATLNEEISKAQDNEEYVPTKVIPGYYRDNTGLVWKVQFNQAQTNMYALKRINAKKYEYVAGAIKNITPDMFVSVNPLDITLEEAKAYGRKTGNCYMCNRELTKQSSIDAGIGPICAEKF